MDVRRRNLLGMISLGALVPSAFSKYLFQSFQYHPSELDNINFDAEKLYEKSIVIDGLIISRGWDEDSFRALEASGYTGFSTSLMSSNYSVALESLANWQRRINVHSDKLILATSANDIINAKKAKKVGVLLGFQNATMIEDKIDNLNGLYEAGTRWIQLTYNERNLLGDGCTERTNAGLSDFGLEAVEKMNELGIIIDVSHCGRQTTDDAIRFSKTAISINHSMCEALHRNHPRAKTDQQIKSMAKKGGVMGIISLGYMIGPNLGSDTTFSTYLDHIEHAVNIGGIDHVGLAADFAIEGLEANGATRENWYLPRLTRFKPSYKVQWPPWIPELDSPHRYKYVAQGLEKRGYKGAEIEKILGLNWLRLYRDIFG